MESVNQLGKSLPTYTLRILTLSKTEAKHIEYLAANSKSTLPGPPKVPELPDTKACCRRNNVTHSRYSNHIIFNLFVYIFAEILYLLLLKIKNIFFSVVSKIFVILWHYKMSKFLM